MTWIAADMGLKIHQHAIERAHRLNTESKPRPIIVKLTYHQDKEDILKYQKYLEKQWTGIVIKEDFSKTVREERKILGLHMLQARKEGKYAVLNYNKLQIEEEIFRYNKEGKNLEKVGDKKKPIQSDANIKRKRELRAGTDSPANEAKVSRGETSRDRRIRNKHNQKERRDQRREESPLPASPKSLQNDDNAEYSTNESEFESKEEKENKAEEKN